MTAKLRCSRLLTLLFLLAGIACAVPRPRLVPLAPLPRPEEGEDDERQRQAWIESLHRAAPGVDWREIEKENRARNRAKLADPNERIATGGAWVQRGPTTQTGRTWVTAVAGDGDTLLVGSGDIGGGLFSGTPGGSGWAQRANLIGSGVQYLVVVPGSPETWVAVANNYSEVFVSADQGASWSPPGGLPSSPCGFVVTRLLREGGSSRRVYLLATAANCMPQTYTLLRSDDAGFHFAAVASGTYTVAPDIWTSRLAAGSLYLVTDAGFKVSADHGSTFTLLGNLPSGSGFQFRLAGSEAGAPSFYAVRSDFTLHSTLLFTSNNGGTTWINRGIVSDFASYMGPLIASSSNPNVVLLGGVEAYRSTDGGVSFSRVNEWPDYYGDPAHKLHADIRGLEVFPYHGSETLIVDTDGGSYRSTDLGATFSNVTQSGMINGQYYSTLTSKNDPDRIAAGSQDQGLQQSAPAPLAAMGFEQLISGDFGHLTSTAGDHNRLYSVYPNSVNVLDRETAPQTVVGYAYPFPLTRSWMPFILADPADANAVYLAGNPLYRGVLGASGFDWTAFPQDFSAGAGDFLTAFGISRANPSFWYAASSEGRLWYSHNQGATWAQSSSPGPAAHFFYGTTILPSPTAASTCFVGGSGYSGPAVYKTTDGGVTWQPMSGGLPSTLVLGLAFDDPVRQTLYAAAEAGAFVFDPAAASWRSLVAENAPLQGYWSVEGVPAVSVMRFGTYGKGIWDYRTQPPGLRFYTLPPCRVIDTRGAAGRLAGPSLQALTQRLFALSGACGIPSTALAVSANVTVAGPGTAGYLTLGASDRSLPATSTINFRAGGVKANNAIIQLSTDGAGGIVAFNGSVGPVPFILDVNGYFQ